METSIGAFSFIADTNQGEARNIASEAVRAPGMKEKRLIDMKKIYQYVSYAILPIVLLLALCTLYKRIMCYFANSSPDASFVCEFKWKDGFVLLCCYTVVRLLSPVLEFNSVLKRLIITIALYCLVYALIAFPFLLASFFQPFSVNVFIHVLIMIILIEMIFLRISRAFANRQ